MRTRRVSQRGLDAKGKQQVRPPGGFARVALVQGPRLKGHGPMTHGPCSSVLSPQSLVLFLWPLVHILGRLAPAVFLQKWVLKKGTRTVDREPRAKEHGHWVLYSRSSVLSPRSLSRQRFYSVRTHFCRNIAGARWTRPRTDDQGPETQATCSWVLGPCPQSLV